MNKDKPKPTKKYKPWWIWPLVVFVVAIFMSFTFSILSELTLSKATIIISVFVILFFIAISIIFDMLGLAVASCEIEPFNAMASKKIKGSKQALSLVKNADKVSSICADVIGDVCGILSGAAGASILAKIALTSTSFSTIIISSLISAIIAGLTIGGKASFKRFAINHCTSITLLLAKIVNVFTHKG